MKYLLIIICILIFTLYSCSSEKNKNPVWEYELALVWKYISTDFTYIDESGVNIDSLYIETIRKLEELNSEIEFHHCLQHFVNQFHEGHLRYLPPSEHKTNRYTASISAQFINGKYFVDSYGSEFKEIINYGDEIISINNVEILEYVENVLFPNYNCSKYSYKYTLSQYLFDGNKGDKMKIVLKQEDGTTYNIKTSTQRHKFLPNHLNNYNIYNENFKFKKIGDIALIKINSFTPNFTDSFINLLDSIKDCNSVIFDIRGNRGGMSTNGEVCKYFTDLDSICLYKKSFKINSSIVKSTGAWNNKKVKQYLNLPDSFNIGGYEYYLDKKFDTISVFLPKIKDPIAQLKDKDVVFLIDYNTASAAESFVLEFKAIGKGFCIGQPTFGSCNMPTIYPMPSGGLLFVPSNKTHLCNGNLFTNIQADIKIDPSIKSLINQEDTILKAALNYLNLKQ